MKKIIVTGGAGFIGSNIVDLLIENGYSVAVIDNLSRGKKSNINDRARFYQADIKGRKIEEILKKEKPDAICHQAAQVNVRLSLEDPISDAQNNILGPIKLTQAATKAKIRKIVFSSSGGAVYGDPEKIPCSEESRIR
ncbi:unnamed protein product, partial [marine sediment metagenome]